MEPPVARPFVWPIRVVAEDIDAQDHVSNVRVVDWANRAAIAHSEALGYDVARYREIGGIFVVRRHEVDYHAPAYLDDELILWTWPSSMERAASQRRHLIWRPRDGRKIAEVLTSWVFVDTTNGRPRRVPEEVRADFDPANFA